MAKRSLPNLASYRPFVSVAVLVVKWDDVLVIVCLGMPWSLEFQASEKIEGLELLAAKKGKHDETVPGDGSQAQKKISHDTGKGRSHMIQQMIGMYHYYHVLFIVLSIGKQLVTCKTGYTRKTETEWDLLGSYSSLRLCIKIKSSRMDLMSDKA